MAGALFGDAFPPAGSGGTQDLTGTADTSKYAMGTHFRPVEAVTVTGVRWFVPTADFPSNADFAVGLVRSDPTNGVSGAGGTTAWLDWNTGVTKPTASDQGTWVTLPLSSPQAVNAGDELYVVVRTDAYAFSQFVFANGSGTGHPGADPRVVYDANLPNFPCGAFLVGGAEAPNPPSWTGGAGVTEFNQAFYGVDVELAASSGTGPAWSLWDGAAEQPLTLDGRWNGATIDPLTFDQVT